MTGKLGVTWSRLMVDKSLTKKEREMLASILNIPSRETVRPKSKMPQKIIPNAKPRLRRGQ